MTRETNWLVPKKNIWKQLSIHFSKIFGNKYQTNLRRYKETFYLVEINAQILMDSPVYLN